MAQIDIFPVTSFMGRLKKAHRLVGVIDPPPGEDGNGVIRSGWRAMVQQIVTSVEVTAGAVGARILRDQYRLLQGNNIIVIDQFSESWNVTVINVDVEYSQTLNSAQSFRVIATWKFLPTTEPALPNG